ncbi:MAG: hypothetical protein J5780_01260, partial [Treponema sp.]|nr:hypothetical protein [Treponema sp.]
MKKHFKGFASLALSVMLAAGITACSNQLEQGSFTEVKKGRVILDNDFVTVRVVESEARAVTEQVSYTKEDWAYNTTTVTYDGV